MSYDQLGNTTLIKYGGLSYSYKGSPDKDKTIEGIKCIVQFAGKLVAEKPRLQSKITNFGMYEDLLEKFNPKK